MLRACKGLSVHHQNRIDHLPFDSAKFDLVTAVCVYHHVPVKNRLPLTTEILRVVKPGGVFAVIEHNPWNPITRLIVSRTPVDANAQLLTLREVRRLAAAAGARVEQTRYFLYLPEKVHQRMGFLENCVGWLPFGGQYFAAITR
jgi:SAM-dependent methyltransferase